MLLNIASELFQGFPDGYWRVVATAAASLLPVTPTFSRLDVIDQRDPEHIQSWKLLW